MQVKTSLPPEAAPRGNYCIISPARNEAGFIKQTLDSVLAQTILPRRWIIIDDGSTDDTPKILADYAARHQVIEVHTRTDRGKRALGGGVVDVFNMGMELLANEPVDYICKLDVDLVLPSHYFERLLAEMEADDRLGSVSGKPYFWAGEPGQSKLISERIADDVSVGASKFYRRTFLDEIGGLVKGLIWDGVDCYKGRMLGWRSKSIDSTDLRFIHLRPMGSSDRGILYGRKRLGEGYWFIGAAPIFVLATAVNKVTHKPMVVGSVATLWGYARSWLKGLPRIEDPKFRSFLRRYHRTMLLHGKARTVEKYDRETASLWAGRSVF